LSLAAPFATSSLPLYSAVADTGALVHALLQASPGKKLIGVREWLNLREAAERIAQVLGKKIEFIDSSPSMDMGDPDLEQDFVEMMEFHVEFGFDGGKVDESVLQPAELMVPLQLDSVKEWCEKQDWYQGL
jgi:hypothetical protein